MYNLLTNLVIKPSTGLGRRVNKLSVGRKCLKVSLWLIIKELLKERKERISAARNETSILFELLRVRPRVSNESVSLRLLSLQAASHITPISLCGSSPYLQAIMHGKTKTKTPRMVLIHTWSPQGATMTQYYQVH